MNALHPSRNGIDLVVCSASTAIGEPFLPECTGSGLAMNIIPVPEPVSGGLFLTYKCTSNCRHCMYACSPKWTADWLAEDDAHRILSQFADRLHDKRVLASRVSLNHSIHFTGGEPFLNYDLLLKLTEMASQLGIPSTFVETNCFWCRDDNTTRERLLRLKEAGLEGILISANPFVVEQVPFQRTERAVRIARQVFGDGVMVYQAFFYNQFKRLGVAQIMPFEEYLRRAGHGLQRAELLPNGRVPFKLSALFAKHPANRFFRESCRRELLRDWHIHIDNYGNYIPGYCAGISLGDARDSDLFRGIDLDQLLVVKALLTNMRELYDLAVGLGYKERDGYVSKCHLCADIRRQLVSHGHFPELAPQAFYDRLED